MMNFFPNPKLRGILFSHLRSVFGFKCEFDELVDGVPVEYAVALFDGDIFDPVELIQKFYYPWLARFTVDAYKEFEALPKSVQNKMMDRFGPKFTAESLNPNSVLGLFYKFVDENVKLDKYYSDKSSGGQWSHTPLSGRSMEMDDKLYSLMYDYMCEETSKGNFGEAFMLFENKFRSGSELFVRILSYSAFASNAEEATTLTGVPLSTRFVSVLDLYGSMVESHRSLTSATRSAGSQC